MAAKAKGDGGRIWKEKVRGASPSTPLDETPKQQPGKKPIPNYLKPTISSGHDDEKLGMETSGSRRRSLNRRNSLGNKFVPSATAAARKPSLYRRRSFDNKQPMIPSPPPTSHAKLSTSSPSPKIFRSQPTASAGAASSKPNLQRPPAAGKSQTSSGKPRNTKKSGADPNEKKALKIVVVETATVQIGSSAHPDLEEAVAQTERVVNPSSEIPILKENCTESVESISGSKAASPKAEETEKNNDMKDEGDAIHKKEANAEVDSESLRMEKEKTVPREDEAMVREEKGKKESLAHNDVIKEAATKLQEERKNRVTALVGAFETVISSLEPESGSGPGLQPEPKPKLEPESKPEKEHELEIEPEHELELGSEPKTGLVTECTEVVI